MFSICIVSQDSRAVTQLQTNLSQRGFACSIIADGDEVTQRVAEQAPDLVLLAMDNYARIRELSREIKQVRAQPVIVLAGRKVLDTLDGHLAIDDFVIQPGDIKELELRIKRLLQKSAIAESGDVIRYGDLIIDMAKYEVSVGNRLVMLTFREYELLKFLASNRGRVFTREALLNKVWGYDYYGGDRTVDVHIRRLRSKLEDATHTFIDTVRNIGYRFKKDT